MTSRKPSNLSLVSLAKTLLGTVTGLVFCSLVVIVGWLNSADFDARLRTALVNGIQSKTGHNADFSDFRADLWPPGFELKGVAITDALSQEDIVAAQRARATVVLRNGRVAIGRISLIRPTVSLHVGPDGRIEELRGLAGPKNQPIQQLPWKHIYMEDGVVELFLQEGKITIGEIQIDTAREPKGLDASLHVEVKHIDRVLRVRSDGIQLGTDQIELPPS